MLIYRGAFERPTDTATFMVTRRSKALKERRDVMLVSCFDALGEAVVPTAGFAWSKQLGGHFVYVEPASESFSRTWTSSHLVKTFEVRLTPWQHSGSIKNEFGALAVGIGAQPSSYEILFPSHEKAGGDA